MLFGSFEFLFNHLRLLQIAARAGQDHDRRSEAFRSAARWRPRPRPLANTWTPVVELPQRECNCNGLTTGTR